MAAKEKIAPRAPYVCWAVQFMRPDGTDAHRRDYYENEQIAREIVRKCTAIQTARVRLVKFVEVQQE
jgi:hypothetical protein